VNHYATGHTGATVEPGLPALFSYIKHFAENYGAIPLGLSVAGVAALCRRDLRLATLTYLHPVVFVVYMCSQSVLFERNVVAVHVFIAIGLALALIELPKRLSAMLERHWPALGARARVAGLVLVVLPLLAGVPWGRAVYAYAFGIEPRNEAASWVERFIDKKTLVLLDARVAFDKRTLSKKVRPHEVLLPSDNDKVEALRKKHKRVIAIVRPAQRKQYSALLGGAKQVALFDAPPEKPGGVEIRPLMILERR
jgi:hypothetical protein